jgi:hypothetical protein
MHVACFAASLTPHAVVRCWQLEGELPLQPGSHTPQPVDICLAPVKHEVQVAT